MVYFTPKCPASEMPTGDMPIILISHLLHTFVLGSQSLTGEVRVFTFAIVNSRTFQKQDIWVQNKL